MSVNIDKHQKSYDHQACVIESYISVLYDQIWPQIAPLNRFCEAMLPYVCFRIATFL